MRGIAGWLFPGAGLFLFVAMPLSPWLAHHAVSVFVDTRQVQAQQQSCEVARDGRHRQNAIQCTLQYEWAGQPHTVQTAVWTSQSPFDTATSLAAQRVRESQHKTRTVEFDVRDPGHAIATDDRALAMPAAWLYLLLATLLCGALAVYLEPGGRMYRRADLRRDPATGELVEINGNRRRRRRLAAAAGGATILAVAIGCLYGVSQRVANAAAWPALSGMVETPARLVDCVHRMYGSYRGHNQIDCAFEFRWNGQAMRGQADSLDFRFLPTDSRMDAAVTAALGKPVTAYVDPARPAYTRAFLSDDWFVAYTWGLFELMQLFVLACVLPILAWITLQSLRRDG